MHFAHGFFAFVLKFGGWGLLALGILDSSFLFAPWGNDLLVVAMTARHPTDEKMLYFAAMSTAGSVPGCLLLDLTMRPLGAHGLEKYIPARRLKRVKNKVEHNAGQTLAVASLVPPPFPFTIFVMAAAAMQYSRARLLTVIAATRILRFTVLGFLALRFGTKILQWFKDPVVGGLIIGLIIICTIGSVVSVYRWIRRARLPVRA